MKSVEDLSADRYRQLADKDNWLKWQQQFADNPQIQTDTYFDKRYGFQEAYFALYNLQAAEAHVGGATLIDTGRVGVSLGAGPCSLVIAFGQDGSDKWILAHLYAGRGFPAEFDLVGARSHLVGPVSVFLFGAEVGNDICNFRDKQRKVLRKQFAMAGMPIEDSLTCYYNDIPMTCNNVIAKIDASGVEYIHIQSVAMRPM